YAGLRRGCCGRYALRQAGAVGRLWHYPFHGRDRLGRGRRQLCADARCPSLAFHRATGQPGNDVALGQGDEGDVGHDGDGQESQDAQPVRTILTLELHDAERPGIFGFRIQHDQWQQEAVPAADEIEYADRGDDGQAERQGDVPVDFDVAAI